MSTYRAAVCTDLTGPQAMEIQERTAHPLQPGQVRMAVKAAGLNFPDLLMTYGKYQFRPEPPFVPGLDAAGVISEVASDVSRWRVGDRVMAGSKGGTFAEQMVVPTAACSTLPSALSFDEGACWQTAASTSWHALVEQGKLISGETVLILGASGGVGMAAIKLSKDIGAAVIGTGSTEEKRQIILKAGADHALDPADPELAAKVKDITNGMGAEVVYDPVGGDLATKATRSIAHGGRYLIIGFASGDIPSFPANHILIKTYTVIGVRAGATPRRVPEIAARQKQALIDLAARGAMRPHISHRFALDEIESALLALEERKVVGRAVLLID
ncbi:MAG: NADPH:quinone oxidoreductase family protein [Parasphingorhabdus sp.]